MCPMCLYRKGKQAIRYINQSVIVSRIVWVQCEYSMSSRSVVMKMGFHHHLQHFTFLFFVHLCHGTPDWVSQYDTILIH